MWLAGILDTRPSVEDPWAAALAGSSVHLLILSHIRVRWGPPKLKVGALRLQGTQRLVGPERQGTNTLGVLDGLKGGLGIQYNNEAVEVAQG